MKFSTIAVIYNPISTGPSESLAKEFVEKVAARLPKQDIKLIATERANHAESLAYDIAKKSEHALIISSSGDGGYNEVVNGAMKAQGEGSKVTTGLLPAGNANDHFHNLNEKDIVELVVTGETKKIDVLKISSTSKGKSIERFAHSYIGIGLTPIVGKELNKVKLNIFTEVWVVARALLRMKSVRLKINNRIRRYESIVFSNVDEMSKHLKISAPSRVTDGEFEVTIFTRRDKLRLILVLLKASLGGVVQDARVSRYELETISKTLVQVDGEILSLDAGVQATVTIDKQALSCIV